MATSGTVTFSLNADEIIREASELVGGEPLLGNELRSARRALNLLLLEWQNRNILLWKITQTIVTLVSATQSYTLTSGTVDTLGFVLTRASLDVPMTRLSFAEWLQIPNKYQTGRPLQYFVDRQRAAPVLYVWPRPENSTDQVKFWRHVKIDDVTALAQDIDVPVRFYPALARGLAMKIGEKRPGFPLDKLLWLKGEYLEQLNLAMEEDRERVNLHLVPKVNTP